MQKPEELLNPENKLGKFFLEYIQQVNDRLSTIEECILDIALRVETNEQFLPKEAFMDVESKDSLYQSVASKLIKE